jgi:hypothetical protein
MAPVVFANLLASQLAKTYPDASLAAPFGAVAGGSVLGDVSLANALRPWYQFDTAQEYFVFTTLMTLVVAAAFVVVARRFNRAQAAADAARP